MPAGTDLVIVADDEFSTPSAKTEPTADDEDAEFTSGMLRMAIIYLILMYVVTYHI